MRKLVAVVAVAAGLVYVVNRSPEVTTTPPDTRFAQHIDGLCEIARAHEATPVPGTARSVGTSPITPSR